MHQRLFLLSLLLVACGPAARAVGPSIAALGGARDVVALTDLEEARDAARVGDRTFVATDDGLFVFGEGDAPVHLGREEGLPSEDVIAVVADGDAALVATAAGLVSVAGTTVTPVAAPPTQRITDLAMTTDGTAWVCSLSGLVRRSAGAWEVFGDPFPCTTLAPTPEGTLWVGTANGLYLVEGDVLREHAIAGGIPDGYVRAIVPVLPGQILALLSGPTRTKLGFFDGTHWYGYVLPVVGEERVVGLVRAEGATLLVTTGHAYVVAPTGAGSPFVATDASDAQVHSFRAVPTPAASATAPAEVSASDTLRAPSQFAEARSSGSVAAPSLVARAFELGDAGHFYGAFTDDTRAYAGMANAGVVVLARGGATVLRSRSLVSDEDLQLATDLDSAVWVRGQGGDVAKWVDGRLRRLALPAEVVPQAIASGPEGAYLIALVRGTSTVRVYTSTRTGFRQLLERTLTTPTTLDGIPFAGVGRDGRVWAALRVAREDGVGTRMRGAVVLDPTSDTVVYHHRGAEQAAGGLPLADEVSAVSFDAAGNAWFATLSGAVRVEASQAIVFGESRGVRGDVVTDIVAGSGVMWIAAAEGLGSYADREFDFFQPPIVASHRPTALATDADGHVWAAGRYGLLQFDGTSWAHFDSTSGLPTDELRDVEVDGLGRVWLLTPDALLIVSR